MNLIAFIKVFLSLLLSVVTAFGSVSLPVLCRQEAPKGVLEEAEPLSTEQETEEIFAAVSDKLELPLITKTAAVTALTADLNAALAGNLPAESLQAEAFRQVFDKVLIFRADADTAYVLGQPTAVTEPLRRTETGYYIPLNVLAAVIGGDLTETAGGAALANGEARLTVSGETAALRLADGAETAVDYLPEAGVNVKDAAKLYGLTEYHTDAGLVFFSLGAAFDPTAGYYVAEEAEKLYLSPEKAETFSANQFVQLPHIVRNGDRGVTAYTYPALDLNANVSAYAMQGVTAKVDLGPAIVAGQGAHRDNRTVVRIFDAYQTLHTEFCAYPADVRGGVQVAAARAGGVFRILTAPYTDKTVTALRCFDANGAFQYEIEPAGKPPYAVAAGAFLGEETGDVFAAISRNADSRSRTLEFFSAEDGSLLRTETLSVKLPAGALLSPDRVSDGVDALLVFAENNFLAYEYRDGALTELPLDLKAYNGVYASAFGSRVATFDAKDLRQAFSEIDVYRDGASTTVNVGAKENQFYSTAAGPDGNYVKYGQFWHTRLEFGTDAHNNTRPGDTASVRTNDIAAFTRTPGAEERSKYNTQYNMWEPCATHRWNPTGGMRNLIEYIDPDTGLNGYATLNKEDKRIDYIELGSSYFNGTYAPYIEAMDRFNYWTRRTYLQDLAVLYRDAPEYTAAVSPVHEHEIDSGENSVGDYNPRMIAGFRLYLKDLYGTVEAVNEAFGTDFVSFDALDAPRDAGRGPWDRYPQSAADANPYFDQWVIYNRSVVSQRIVEAYREALLAGFPPELIKAHQIPEGDAVAGLLGEVSTRISPVDVVLSLGTGYGGTRYFTWFRDRDSFLSLAWRSGHANSTLGEYSALNTRKLEAYRQLKFLFDHGVMFTHVMNWAGGTENGEKIDANEKYAVDRLQRENIPRSASSGGTGNVCAYVRGDTAYDIVEIGSGKDDAGLLKSVNEDGSFEGTVYLQPFHAEVVPVTLAQHDTASGTGRLRYAVTGRTDANGKAMPGIQYGDTVDVRVTARPLGEAGTLTVQVWNAGNEIPAASYTFDVTGEETEYRYVFKNQLWLPDCSVTVTFRNAAITDSDVTLLYERTARKFYGETDPAPAAGGVSFDLLY